MRRTVRALSVVVLAGAAFGGVVPVAVADPAAEVSPASVEPEGSVTVSVSCDPVGGTAPATIEATSQAFGEEAVQLQRVPGNDAAAGPAYRGTARIASGEDYGDDSAWTVDGACPAEAGAQGRPWSATFDVTDGGGTGHGCTEPRVEPCASTSAPVQRGVHAGTGGAFTDSVPALVAGGVLIAGALGGAVYRVRRRTPRGEA
ncbi:hypothetical protein EJC51_38120 [Streptomyces aquilus]|uniref:LPXTG cell wall anchor domain-containing protein n=1 Tax=Streptomyces aquilus TaxID=2548456 RepID=A0A3Q9C424_9ACTN|nr:hypothetical protein [Streptomyces aquilus]AZP21388.1 hypothetical protein EJC51_38120 [Streptomyces aquilus]